MANEVFSSVREAVQAAQCVEESRAQRGAEIQHLWALPSLGEGIADWSVSLPEGITGRDGSKDAAQLGKFFLK